MRAFIILATIALTHGAKLERTYLPPSHAGTSGGSENFLQTPNSGSNFQNGFSQTGHTEASFSNGFSQNAAFSNNGNGFSQNGNGFSQTGSGFSENEYSQSLKNTGFNYAESRPERAQAALERNAAILRQDSTNDGETFAYAFETENGIYAEENGVATNGVEAQGGYSYTGDDGQVYSIRYTADQNGFVPQGDHIPTAPPVPEEILKALEQNARDEAAGIFDDGSYNEAKYSGNSNNQQIYQQAYNGNDDTVVTNAAVLRNFPTNADTPKSSSASYLPPFASQAEASASNRASNTVAKAYIPPFASSNSRRPASARTSTKGSNGSFAARRPSSNGVEKAYLPPFAQSGNGFRRQSFDSKNGYQY